MEWIKGQDVRHLNAWTLNEKCEFEKCKRNGRKSWQLQVIRKRKKQTDILLETVNPNPVRIFRFFSLSINTYRAE